MYVNGKTRPVETILGMDRKGIKENDGGDEFKYDILEELLYMPQCIPRTTIKNEIKRNKQEEN
jgi:hypothetical protein